MTLLGQCITIIVVVHSFGCDAHMNFWRFSSFHPFVQWEGRTALMLANKGGHLDLVKELVGAQADVDEQDEVCSLSS